MAVIPQVITSDRASGAQVIDGSLGFSGTNQKLERTPGSAGNQQTWTWSSWVKINPGQNNSVFAVYTGASDRLHLRIGSSYAILAQNTGSWDFDIRSNAKFRDNEWYHFVCVADFTNSTQNDRAILYVNGERLTLGTNTLPSNTTTNTIVNATKAHYIGESYSGTDFDGRMSQVYLIDGQALEPTEFGFTDPLTNTWKPKKYTGDFNIFPDIGMGGDSGQAIEVVINRQVDKAWIKKYGSSTYEGGGDPSDPSSAPSFNLPSGGSLYWFTTAYDTAHTFVLGSSSETGTQPEWASGGTTGSLTRDSATTVSGTPSSSYSSARTDALADNTVYAFTFTITTGAGGAHTGWFLSTSSSYSTGTPDEQTSGNTVGARFGGGGTGYYNYVKVYGTFATLNPNTNGQLSNRGVNSFYLPMDGNSPIGKDKSGNGNDWTPVNFGGSLELDNPNVSGARPILNTTQGGTVAGVGVFGSKQNVGYAVTVYDDGGGNKFYIDGVKTASITGLIRGATYTFDTSDSTVGSTHPFRLSATSNGSHGGGSEYTNGVAAITGAATTITIPHDAPNTLYYYCTSHSGMGNDSSISGITTNEKLADQYASNIVFAAPLVGSNGDVSASIACTATTHAVTTSGATSSGGFGNFYNESVKFDGTNDYITWGSNTDWKFLSDGTTDYTMETWIRATSTYGKSGRGYILFNTAGSIGSGENGMALWLNSSALRFQICVGGGIQTIFSHSYTLPADKWVHLALVNDGGDFGLFIDGIRVAVNNSYSTWNSNNPNITLNTGRTTDNYYFNDGYMQDMRIYNIAKYTSNFVVPSTSPNILPDTPSGVSGGSKLTKITDGAVAFDGTSGTSMNIANSSDFSFGSGDWTVECYHYSFKAAASGTNSLIGIWNSGSNRRTWLINLYQDYFRGYFSIDGAAGGSIYQVGDSAKKVAPNRWYHVALVRNGNNLLLFQDGELIEATDVTGQSVYDNTTDDLYIGSGHAGTVNNTNGYISNLRVVKGTALYTSDFTPPTEPLTNVTNTKLLCCQSPTSVESSAVGPITSDFYSAGVYLTATTYTDRGGSSCTITNNDSVTSSSAGTNSFGLTTAADMTGEDRVDINMGNVSGSFFQSEWTLEMFFKKDASDNNWFVGTSTSGASWQTGWSLNVDGTTLKWNYDDQSGGQSKSTGITINNDTWYFMRVQRTPSTSQSRLYIEVYDSPTNRSGTFDGTVQDDQSHSNNTLKIGDANGNSNNLTANWQFANVMITAGTRRNQVVPTLSSGQRVLNATIDSLVVPIGNPTATNFNPFNTDINTVRGQETGYATLNPLAVVGSATYSDGNLKVTGSAAYRSTPSTIGMSEGKWYVEYFFDTWVNDSHVGVMNDISPATTGTWAGNTANGFAWAGDSGDLWTNGSTYNSSFDVSFGTGDTCQIAFDADNGRMYFGKNGLWLKGANPSVGTGANWTGLTDGPYHPFVTTTNGTICSANFGQKPFKFPPPDGFQPLNTVNTRPVKVISRPDQYVGVTTYSGNSGDGLSTTQDIDVGLNPDLIWIKHRNGTNSNLLTDTVRGLPNTLIANSTATTNTNASRIPALIYNGFRVGDRNEVNDVGGNYVAWCWKAGGSKNTFNVDDVGYASAAAAGLNGGTLTVTGASVGTKQGFSIIKFTGTGVAGSVSHGLTQKPDFIIAKNIDGTPNDWPVHHSSLTDGTYTLYLNGTAAASAATAIWPSASTDSVINVGSGAVINESANSTILYSWHDVPGLQKFGEYVGNGNANGAFIELGFRPKIIIAKASTGGGSVPDWLIFDSERDSINPADKNLSANYAGQEQYYTGGLLRPTDIDILSNGFKIRNTRDANNANGSNFIYAAWAEAPSVDLYGGGANAR